MSITYNLRDNKLTSEESDYMAHVISSRQVELDEVIERMMESRLLDHDRTHRL